MTPFKEEMRYKYDLNKTSLVIDVGAYHGLFSLEISERYGCNIEAYEPVPEFFDIARVNLSQKRNIRLIRMAVGCSSYQSHFGIKGCMSGLNTIGDSTIDVKVCDISDVIGGRNIDLIKLNIEGAEYDLLQCMIERGLHLLARNIQVQFHSILDCEQRWIGINQQLSKSHVLTYREPFWWENYERHENNNTSS